jgi:hypothetical protein
MSIGVANFVTTPISAIQTPLTVPVETSYRLVTPIWFTDEIVIVA